MEINLIWQTVPGVFIALVASLINWKTQSFLLTKRISADDNLVERKIKFDMELAERKFQYDRDLHDHKRRVELAEAVLADFLQMKTIIAQIREAGSFENENKDRLRDKYETEEQAKQKNTYFVPLARIVKNSGFISVFMSKRYRSNAVLGENIEYCFKNIEEVIISVESSANQLIHMIDRRIPRDDTNRALWDKCEQNIWQDLGDPDILNTKIQDAVSVVEKICRPILERT